MTDQLAQLAHFRPAVIKKVKQIREEVVKQIQKADETSKAEERALERERAKKLKRDQELNALDAKGQRKYLEKEKEKEMRRNVKKQTARA
jgi:Skp family chaperone for outer membrane proteins